MTSYILGAVLATAAYFVLGALWFTPLFGGVWDRSIGYDRSASGGTFPVSYYLTPMIGAAATTIAITTLICATQAGTALGGLGVGCAVGLAAAAASVTNSLTPHTPSPFTFGTVTGGYHLVGCGLAGLIVGALA